MSEEAEVVEFPHWLMEYDGVHVVAQLKGVYYTVRSPGTVVPLGENGAPIDLSKPHSERIAGYHSMPVVQGSAQVKKDGQGNYRIVIKTPDPAGSEGFVFVDLDPDAIDGLAVYKEEKLVVG